MRDLSHGRLVLGRIQARTQQVTVMLPVSMPRGGAAALPGVEALTAASVVRRIDAMARCKQLRRFGSGSLLHGQRQLPAAASTVKRLQYTSAGSTQNIKDRRNETAPDNSSQHQLASADTRTPRGRSQGVYIGSAIIMFC